MTGEITILIAFSAGILSFFSPCILPLIPAYLSFISGSTFSPDENASAASLIKVAASTLLFVLGFTIIFTALGASASLLGGFIGANKLLLSRVGGAIIIFMGLVLAGLIKIPALHAERRLRLSNRPFGMLGAVPIGMVFGLGWTPCVGPVLSSILVLAAGQVTASSGGLLLGSDSIGMGVPVV
ncbi:MAG: cytochrome c biogenesis CcdA family protein, partial [Terriglobia bacterium]